MCQYCQNEKELARLDLDDENETFIYLKIIDGVLRVTVESTYEDNELSIQVAYCPVCGKKLEAI